MKDIAETIYNAMKSKNNVSNIYHKVMILRILSDISEKQIGCK